MKGVYLSGRRVRILAFLTHYLEQDTWKRPRFIHTVLQRTHSIHRVGTCAHSCLPFKHTHYSSYYYVKMSKSKYILTGYMSLHQTSISPLWVYRILWCMIWWKQVPSIWSLKTQRYRYTPVCFLIINSSLSPNMIFFKVAPVPLLQKRPDLELTELK